MDQVKTGTTTVGLKCKDAIILAADKRATAGNLIVDRNVQKIRPITDRIAVTTAGSVSDLQLLEKYLKAELRLKRLRSGRDATVAEAANLLAGMVYANIRAFTMIPGITHFLLAGSDSEGLTLYDLYPDGSLTKVDDFVATGSGSVMAFGVLETLWKPTIIEAEGADLALKCVNAALQRDSASGNGIDIYAITKKGVRPLQTKLLNTSLV